MTINWSEIDPTSPMEIPLSSSAISKVKWVPSWDFSRTRPTEGDLTIWFTDGTVYEYSQFPISEFLSFVSSSSAGRWFNYQIRDNFSFTRIA